MDADQKKADEHGLTLAIWDEGGFSFSPNCGGTWAPVGETPILLETSGRHNHTGVGFITRTPHRHLLEFRFTIFKGAACFEDIVFLLNDLHRHYGCKVVILWDHLPAHHAAENHFEDEHPGWFEFEYFPTYSPELNPVESCWNQMKNVYLSHFFPKTDAELTGATHQAAQRINDERLLLAFFKFAKLKL